MKITYKGTLETYYETGMESLALILYLKKFKYKNENYDPKDRMKGPKYWHSFDGMVMLKKGDKIKITKCKNKKMEGKSFTIGNLKMARADNFRITAYPEESISLLDWRILFDDKTEALLEKNIQTIAFYGGTFDPVHYGHLEIIKELRYRYDLILVLPGNNWTKKKPMFSLSQRINSVKVVTKNIFNVMVLDWSKNKDTSSTYKNYLLIKKEFPRAEIHIVIGKDNVLNIENWKYWNKLKKVQFSIINRESSTENLDISKFDKRPIFVNLKPNNYSSTKIRETGDISDIPKDALKYLKLSLLPQNENNLIKK